MRTGVDILLVVLAVLALGDVSESISSHVDVPDDTQPSDRRKRGDVSESISSHVDVPDDTQPSDRRKRGLVALETDYVCYYKNKTIEPVIQDVKRSCKIAHNRLRAKHGVKALRWSATLEAEAKEWAETMAADQKMYHSTGAGYGENIAMISVSVKNVVHGPPCMIRKWYNEIMNWDYSKNAPIDSTKNWGHFTQMVWAKTTRVGCGLSSVLLDNKHITYLCCRYTPPGNYKNQYAENVPPVVDGDNRAVVLDEIEEKGRCDYLRSCSKYKKYCPDIMGTCYGTCAP